MSAVERISMPLLATALGKVFSIWSSHTLKSMVEVEFAGINVVTGTKEGSAGIATVMLAALLNDDSLNKMGLSCELAVTCSMAGAVNQKLVSFCANTEAGKRRRKSSFFKIRV